MAKDTHLVGDKKKNKDLINDCTDRNRYEILASWWGTDIWACSLDLLSLRWQWDKQVQTDH